jgi:hypothetical protein
MDTYFYEHFYIVEPKVTPTNLDKITQYPKKSIKSYYLHFRTLKTKCTIVIIEHERIKLILERMQWKNDL